MSSCGTAREPLTRACAWERPCLFPSTPVLGRVVVPSGAEPSGAEPRVARKSARSAAALPFPAQLWLRCRIHSRSLPRHGAVPSHRLLCAPPSQTPRRVVVGQADLENPEPCQAGAQRPGPQQGQQPQARPSVSRAHARGAHARQARATCTQEAEVAGGRGEGAG